VMSLYKSVKTGQSVSKTHAVRLTPN
jgi:hypothetical protein